MSAEKVKTPDRPVWNDVMKKELAKEIGQQINNWCNNQINNCCNNEKTLEDCISTTEKVLEHYSHENGYALARQFERMGFSPDSELVEILEDVFYYKDAIHTVHVKKWVADNQLTLQFSNGDNVVAKLVQRGITNCEVVARYPEKMQYGVWYPGIGYEKEKGWTIVNAEDVISMQPVAPANN